jgi:hypothetical protein
MYNIVIHCQSGDVSRIFRLRRAIPNIDITVVLSDGDADIIVGTKKDVGDSACMASEFLYTKLGQIFSLAYPHSAYHRSRSYLGNLFRR